MFQLPRPLPFQSRRPKQGGQVTRVPRLYNVHVTTVDGSGVDHSNDSTSATFSSTTDGKGAKHTNPPARASVVGARTACFSCAADPPRFRRRGYEQMGGPTLPHLARSRSGCIHVAKAVVFCTDFGLLPRMRCRTGTLKGFQWLSRIKSRRRRLHR